MFLAQRGQIAWDHHREDILSSYLIPSRDTDLILWDLITHCEAENILKAFLKS